MIIGITGSLAAGKTAATKYLAAYTNGHIIDADKLSHLALRKSSPAYKDVIAAFGRGLLDRNGAVSRNRLAKIAFSSKKNLKKLCFIVHPFVMRKIKSSVEGIYKKERSSFIIIDAPLLIESGLYKKCDCVIVVISSLHDQFQRSQKYKGLDIRQSLERIKFQMSASKKIEYADYIINNDAGLHELKQRCKIVSQKLKKNKRRR
jgi:dephospho-CoA kinase